MMRRRELGTMITYGFDTVDVCEDLSIAHAIGATVLEVLPLWRALPEPGRLHDLVGEAGLTIRSAHGCWGGQSIRAPRVDLADTDWYARLESVDDLKRCADWLFAVGGTHLVVHPGGLAATEEQAERTDALAVSLEALADHVRPFGMTICVENMPPGARPGHRMEDLTRLIDSLSLPEIGLALDTGHGHLNQGAALETLAAGTWLRSTHVHDNDGSSDTHLPPGLGSIDWTDWVEALDQTGYSGPIVLECIRHLRRHPESVNDLLRARLDELTR